MTKLGAHVGKDRNGYGPFCEAGPALVVCLDEGGAAVEAKEKSGGLTTTIFRDTSIYLEFPQLAEWTEAEATRAAGLWWFALRAKWLQNPADYYTITNEQGGGGDDPHAYRVLIAYERRIMQLANAAGYKVCVLNLATGSPGDLGMWADVCLPFIREACEAGNIYGRHAYGSPDIMPLDGNTARPFQELAYLDDFGGRMAITELGFNGGYGFPGVDHFVNQVTAFDSLSSAYPNLIGYALWELRSNPKFNANWQDALPKVTEYLHSVPSPQPIPIPQPVPVPPPPEPEPEEYPLLTLARGSYLNVRSGPRIADNIIGRIGNGTRLTPTDSTPSGDDIWVSWGPSCWSALLHNGVTYLKPFGVERDLSGDE